MCHGLLLIIQLITQVDGVLSLSRRISITGIEAHNLFLCVPVKEDDLSTDLLNEPGSVRW